MLGFTKIDLLTWKKAITALLRRPLSGSELAAMCNINEKTAFNMRLRVFFAAEQLNQNIKLTGEIEADDTSFSFSAKGMCFDEVPRKPRKRGGSNTVKNRQKNEINVMVAVERSKNGNNAYKVASAITGFGQPSAERVWAVLKDKIDSSPETVLITDGARYFGLTARKLGIAWDRLPTSTRGKKRVPTIKNGHSIQTVNNIHKQLQDRFSRSISVSSKYLKGYLQIFDFTKNYSHLMLEEQAELILKTFLLSKIRLTIPELETRYRIPKYKEQVANEWKKHFTKEEVRIYGEIKRGAVKKDLIERYGTTYKRMRTLERKIDELKIDEEVLRASLAPDHLYPISDRSWEIYTLYQTGKYTYEELAKKYDCTHQNVAKIVKRINNRPEGYERNKPLLKEEITARRKKAEFLKRKQETVAFHQEVYDAFNVLCGGNSKISLTRAYQILGHRYGLAFNTVRNIVFKHRKNDENAVWRKKGKGVAIDLYH